MMNIAIFGATSQIAKDLIKSFANQTSYKCTLFARDVDVVQAWLNKVEIYKDYRINDYSNFSTDNHYDVIINFVGIGNPAQAKELGSAIFDITYQYDMMILEYLKSQPACEYLFLSSGSVYGGGFENPVTNETVASVPINNLNATNWYTIAKLYAEARHRALSDLSIVDIRVFNYFSHTQDMDANFFLTELVRSLLKNEVFKTSPVNIVRDFITPLDFLNLIQSIIQSPRRNIAVDCYTKSPVEKLEILKGVKNEFLFNYVVTESLNIVNATGHKLNYYSNNHTASQFGYDPLRSSLQGVLEEIKLVVGKRSDVFSKQF